jgi:hypothetical protein
MAATQGQKNPDGFLAGIVSERQMHLSQWAALCTKPEAPPSALAVGLSTETRGSSLNDS